MNKNVNERMRNELIELYEKNSKHSNYQILASNFSGIINMDELNVLSRYEKERLDYISSKIKIDNKSIYDIGGNCGYFTFEMCNLGAKHIEYFEGNIAHAEFVDKSVQLLNLEDKINVNKKYFSFQENAQADIMLLLNVVHHLGDDYNCASDICNAKDKMLFDVNNLANGFDILVFQMGFNWKGNVDKCLFENGTKQEMIEFVTNGLAEKWKVISIGVAERAGDKIIYKDLDDTNIKRNDELGEFLNRPIFILKRLGD